jgi:WD40 repeat protein
VKNTKTQSAYSLRRLSSRTVVKLLLPITLAMMVTASVPAAPPPPTGNLLVSRTVYAGKPSLVAVGQPLPGGGTAIVDGTYPAVWNNETPDSNFSVTTPIFIDQMADSGAITTMAVPPDKIVANINSKHELGIQISPDGNSLVFMGYSTPVNTLDAGTSDTPGHQDPTNPVQITPVQRAVGQINPDGSTLVTPVNAYSGNGGRAVIAANGFYYMAGNAGNGSGTAPQSVISDTGVQMTSVGGPAETTVVGIERGNCHPPDAKGCQYGFSSVDVGQPTDKSGKDDNFRGITIFNNTLYVTKGSGGNGVNTLYRVGTAGTLPTLATASTTPITIVPGFPTGLAANTAPPLPRFFFGVWFADANTVYLADEGDGVPADAADPLAGLQKWIQVNGTWQYAYTLQNGLNLGTPYSVPNGPNGEVYPTSLNPATDGLRNLTGRVNGDGTVTLWATTSTFSKNKDQATDPNKIVSITDTVAFTTGAQAASEQFTTVRTAGYGEVLRGVTWSAKPFVPASLPPTISGITPATGVQGGNASVLLTGANLSGVTSITFSGAGVTATVASGVTAALPSSLQIPLTVTIAADADLGPHSVTVTTATGSATLPNAFVVQRVASTMPQVIPEVEQGTIQSGYVVITPDPSSSAPVSTATYGTVSGGIVLAQAGIIPAPLTTDAVIYAEVVPGIGRSLGVAIMNPNSFVNAVTLTLRDLGGNTIGNPVILNLQPQQQSARFVQDLFGAGTVSTGFRGSLRVQASQPFSALGLRFSAIQFSSLAFAGLAPVGGVPTRALTAGTVTNTPLAGTVGGSTALVVPQFAMAGGWATQVALVNSGTSTITGRIDVFDVTGNPLPVKLNGATQSTFTYSIAGGGTFVLAPRDANGQSPF